MSPLEFLVFWFGSGILVTSATLLYIGLHKLINRATHPRHARREE